MNQQDVITYFDHLALQWDAALVRNEAVIASILENAGVRPEIDILDVACGTGVLIGDYLSRNVRSVTAVDISPEMVRIAKQKFQQPCVDILCADVESLDRNKRFDCIMVYNAFPHFPDPARLIRHLAGLLAPGGILSIAHGMSRACIDRHHSGSAHRVSSGLMDAEELASIMAAQGLCVTHTVSNDQMYQVCAKRL